MSLVSKIRNTAGGMYGQAKAKYAASPAMQKAGQQAGHATSQVAGKLRDASGRASSSHTAASLRKMSGRAASAPVADRLRELPGKATAAVKDAQSRRPGNR